LLRIAQRFPLRGAVSVPVVGYLVVASSRQQLNTAVRRLVSADAIVRGDVRTGFVFCRAA
jgi:hypothetical protein